MINDKIDCFANKANASIKANKLLNITVERVNEDVLLDAADILKDRDSFISFGVKNTSGIPREYIQQLLESNKYVWHTIDKMSDRGRAIDIDLINPITGKVMTGSSSSTAINVLYGINDIGIGTDGGGSILAPALSLNLFSIMAKGMGLKASSNHIKKSTDGIKFLSGVGVISHSLNIAMDSIFDMLGGQIRNEKMYNDNFKNIKVAVPEIGNITLPNNIDMTCKLEKCINLLKSIGISVDYVKFPNFENRQESIKAANKLLNKYDILITYEGPVDLEGIGDSVFGVMGEFAKNIQNRSGKYMVKIANMLNSTAVTIPSGEASSGIVMITKEGMKNGMILLNLSRKINSLYRLPKLYYEYFKNSNKNRKNEFIFSKD